MKSKAILLAAVAMLAPAPVFGQMTYYSQMYVDRSGAGGYSYAVVPYGWILSSTLELSENGNLVDYRSGQSQYFGQAVYLTVSSHTDPPAYTLYEQYGEAYGELEDYGWFWEPSWLSGITPPPSVSITGDSDEWDGGSGHFSLLVEGGTPSEYTWDASWPYGAGNDPFVSFVSSGADTWTNAHWFAYPDMECAGSPSEYQVNGAAFIDSTPYTDSTPFRVHIPNTGGRTHSPRVAGSVMLIPPGANGLWTVGQNNYYRTQPLVIINVLPSSQFRNKVETHENVHVAQFMTGMFAFYWDPLVAYNRIKNFTDTSFALLSARIENEIGTYNNEQDTLARLQLQEFELQAYAVSDSIAPRFYYQDVCVGY